MLALNGRLCQQFIYAACILIHAVMAVLFYGYGVDALMYYNIGSVVFYISMLIAVSAVKSKTLSLIDIVIGEVMVFSITATVAVGWNCGFSLYLMTILPAPFFMPNEKLSSSLFTSLTIAAAFISVTIYASDPEVITHRIENETQITKVCILNVVVTTLILLYLAMMYVVSHKLIRKLMNEKAEELKMLASIDPLTQLFNRRAMTEYIRQVHESAEETGRTYAIVIADIDNFKKINDNYGHSLGDEVLKKVSATMTADIPSEGYICRWGGEEVLFIPPECREERAAIISEQIRSDISHLRFTSKGVEFSVSMTFGLVSADLQKDYEVSLNLADDYLYCGKENGKNIVVTRKIYEQMNKAAN